jgi:hypothetical protein
MSASRLPTSARSSPSGTLQASAGRHTRARARGGGRRVRLDLRGGRVIAADALRALLNSVNMTHIKNLLLRVIGVTTLLRDSQAR